MLFHAPADALCRSVDEPRQPAVTERRHERQQKIRPLGLVGDAQRRADGPHQPQHPEVAGRVVGKVAVAVKSGGTLGGQLVAPGHKAAHVIGVAVRHKGQHQAQQQGTAQQHPEALI